MIDRSMLTSSPRSATWAMHRKEINMGTDRLPLARVPLTEQNSSKPWLDRLGGIISRMRFFPKTHDFFGYFEKSSENVVKGAELLCKMFRVKEGRQELSRQLKDYEHVGDKITHDVIDLLHQTFLTPIDRSDIHTLVVKLDDVLDIVNFTGNRLAIYNVSELPEEVAKLADIVHQSTREVSKAIKSLEGFKDTKKVLAHCIEVNRLENEADETVNIVIEKLFSNRWEPIEVIKLKELIENLEAAEDKCEDVAEIIENIILKNA